MNGGSGSFSSSVGSSAVCLSPTGGYAALRSKRAELKRTKSQGSTRKMCKAHSCASMEDSTGAKTRFLFCHGSAVGAVCVSHSSDQLQPGCCVCVSLAFFCIISSYLWFDLQVIASPLAVVVSSSSSYYVLRVIICFEQTPQGLLLVECHPRCSVLGGVPVVVSFAVVLSPWEPRCILLLQ